MPRSPDCPRPSRTGTLAAVVVCLVAIVGLLLPDGILAGVDRAAYAVCHRLSERSYVVAGRQLPLCARCSGLYLGALFGIIALVLRGRGAAAQFPARKFVPVIASFMLAWLVDGANSYATFFPSLPHLYAPQNVLRLATGSLAGLAVAATFIPLANMVAWQSPSPMSSVENWGDLAALLAAGGVGMLLVTSGSPILLYPLVIFSGLAILLLLGSLNTIVVLTIVRKAGRLQSWNEVLAPFAVGTTLAILELALISFARSWLTARLGLPL